MVPNSRWFPQSLQERAAWYNNFYNQFQAVAASLGFLPAVVAVVETDNSLMQFLADAALGIDAYKRAATEYRITLTEGSIGEPAPAFPPNPSLGPPSAGPAGLYQRLDDLVKRIRVAPNYTPEIGALLGIVPESTTRPAPDVMQPTIKASTLPGSVVQVKFTRGRTNGLLIETKVDSEGWTNAGLFPTSPAVLLIPQSPQNVPRSVQIRARYVEGNSAVGQFSDTVSTTTQPAV